MLSINIPQELAVPLAEEATRQGTTPELLALEAVRRVLPISPTGIPAAASLLDFLAGHVGTVEGSAEPFSQDCGHRFADGLASGRPARP
jgi:hypothetical protein